MSRYQNIRFYNKTYKTSNRKYAMFTIIDKIKKLRSVQYSYLRIVSKPFRKIFLEVVEQNSNRSK